MENLIKVRRHLHQNPEVGFNTKKTVSYIKDEIINHNIYHVDCNFTFIKGSLIVSLNPENLDKNQKILGFRSDIDALKIKELNNVSYQSTSSYMHACGHDAHTSILLNTIIYLLAHPLLIKNQIVFIFQAAEEGPGNGGAYYLIDEKIVQDIDYLFNVHVNSTLDAKTIYLKDNILYAAGCTFKIKVFGKSSHVNNYHEGIDTLKISLNIINKINNIQSTFLSPYDRSIIMVNKFRSGKSTNVISDYSVIEGTIRYFDQNSLKVITEKIKDIILAETDKYTLSFNNGYPSVVNSSNLYFFSKYLLEHSKINFKVIDNPYYLTDDFSRYANKTRCFYYLLGTKKLKPIPLHSPYFDIDEESMYVGFVFNLLVIKNINHLDSLLNTYIKNNQLKNVV